MGNERISKKDNLFAASRFVLPEHRELYLQMKREQEKYIPPELDEEQYAALSQCLWQALQTRQKVTIHYSDNGVLRSLNGLVLGFDPVGQKVKLVVNDGNVWLSTRALLAIENDD